MSGLLMAGRRHNGEVTFLVFSPDQVCAGEIATASIEAPEAEFDLSCLAALKPQWSLPDDPL